MMKHKKESSYPSMFDTNFFSIARGEVPFPPSIYNFYILPENPEAAIKGRDAVKIRWDKERREMYFNFIPSYEYWDRRTNEVVRVRGAVHKVAVRCNNMGEFNYTMYVMRIVIDKGVAVGRTYKGIIAELNLRIQSYGLIKLAGRFGVTKEQAERIVHSIALQIGISLVGLFMRN